MLPAFPQETMTRPYHSPQDTLSVQNTPCGHPYECVEPPFFACALLTCRAGSIYDTARPCVIDEEDESHAYDTDDAAPSVNIPRFSSKDATDRARKRSSLPPAFGSATTSIYRTANSIISQRSTVSKLPAGMQVRTQFESVPAFEKAPWEMHGQPERPLSMFSIPSGGLRFHSKTKSVMQPRIFQMLPREVYACILQQLEVLHFGTDAQSCTTCYLRDLYNLALTSRAWDKAARNKL